MAIVESNDITLGLRGKFGRYFVFRQVRGRTVVSRAPRKADKSKETVLQRETRTRFRNASAWAKKVLLDPAKREYFQQQAARLKLPNAYTAAIKAYMRKQVPQESQLLNRFVVHASMYQSINPEIVKSIRSTLHILPLPSEALRFVVPDPGGRDVRFTDFIDVRT